MPRQKAFSRSSRASAAFQFLEGCSGRMYSILQSSLQMSCDLPERCCSRARRRNRTMFLSFLSDKLKDVLLKEDIKHSSFGYRTFNSLRNSLSDAHSPEKIFKLMALHAFFHFVAGHGSSENISKSSDGCRVQKRCKDMALSCKKRFVAAQEQRQRRGDIQPLKNFKGRPFAGTPLCMRGIVQGCI